MRISDWSSDVCSSDLACRIAIRVPLLNRAIGGRVAYFTAGGPSLFQSCEEVPEPVNLRMAIEPCRTLGNHIVPHNRVGYRAFRNGWFPSACQLFGWRLRSEERRVGKECVSTCRSGCDRDHYKTKKIHILTRHRGSMR